MTPVVDWLHYQISTICIIRRHLMLIWHSFDTDLMHWRPHKCELCQKSDHNYNLFDLHEQYSLYHIAFLVCLLFSRNNMNFHYETLICSWPKLAKPNYGPTTNQGYSWVINNEINRSLCKFDGFVRCVSSEKMMLSDF